MSEVLERVVRPAAEAELASIVKEAVTSKSSFQIRGGDTRPIGNPLAAAQVLETGGLTGITLYDPGALTLVARAGTPLSDIEAALDAEGQMLPFEPMDHRALLGTTGTPTIGGVVATNASGPRRLKAGSCRDSLIGVRFVTGEGEVVKNGGRVMKNVTGYDLVKLMAGSYGTLGVMTEVSFKVLPKPQATAVLLFEGLDTAEATACLADAMRSPFDVSGAAHIPVGVDGAPVTMIRIEGLEQSVSYRADALAKELRAHGTAEIETDPVRTEAGWRYVRDAEAFSGKPGDVWRVSVKPSDGQRVIAAAGAEDAFLDWQGGLVWLRMAEGVPLRDRIADIPGHATLIRGAGQRAFQPEPMALSRLAQGLRAKFDPHSLFNPGRMI
ncbi:glycolate oxidase subunit GlcE [Pontivivens insulae]|uniref:Putative FAD-linked oxidoreductase n=1 Tax=Pontivivens insulae TaxID=1639689 RepID=A0A2R8AFQ3_9RHOB|nr:glycolate oxidase subunit GlcE [Pontivivens insulae]RED12270.1 glycolate oxidase FAD binding subunit [Pontivivens insulae]SPF31027.1 putative FAD-linked oxidoreductase [Pontivivens insulae]